MDIIDKTILKWEENARRYRDGEALNLGIENCPLCVEYYVIDAKDTCCEGCPIYKRTDQRFCRGTPYAEIFLLYDEEDEKYDHEVEICIQEEIAMLKDIKEDIENEI